MARNKSDNITQLKQRREFDAFNKIFIKLDSIRKTVESLKVVQENTELKRYIPVVLVSTIQSYFRSVAKMLIERDEEYLMNTRKLFEKNGIKLDFELLVNIHKHNFTIAEFISYHFTFSQFDQVEDVMSALLKNSFLGTIRDFVPQTKNPGDIRMANQFSNNYDLIKKDIYELYRVRNIVCHELGDKLELTDKVIKAFNASAATLIYHSYSFFLSIIDPVGEGDILTVLTKVSEEQKTLKLELEKVIFQIIENEFKDKKSALSREKFIRSNRLWEEHAELYLQAASAGFEKKDERDYYFYRNYVTLLESRIEDLKFDFELSPYDH